MTPYEENVLNFTCIIPNCVSKYTKNMRIAVAAKSIMEGVKAIFQ